MRGDYAGSWGGWTPGAYSDLLYYYGDFQGEFLLGDFLCCGGVVEEIRVPPHPPHCVRHLPLEGKAFAAAVQLSAEAIGFPLRGSCRRQPTDEVASYERRFGAAVGGFAFATRLRREAFCLVLRLGCGGDWRSTSSASLRSAPSPRGEGFCCGGAAFCRGHRLPLEGKLSAAAD